MYIFRLNYALTRSPKIDDLVRSLLGNQIESIRNFGLNSHIKSTQHSEILTSRSHDPHNEQRQGRVTYISRGFFWIPCFLKERKLTLYAGSKEL